MSDPGNVLAAKVLLSARRLAREYGHAWIGTEHVLLGILEQEEGEVRTAFEEAGVTSAAVRVELSQLAPSIDQPAKADLPLASSLRQMLDGAVRQTRSRQLEDVTVASLAVAMMERHAGLGYAILVKRGADLDDLARRLGAPTDGGRVGGDGDVGDAGDDDARSA